MTKDKLSKLIKSILYESLKTQRDKYGAEKIDSIKELDPTSTYKYIDSIQKFIYADHADKIDVKKYIDIYNDKLNKNLIDNEHKDINKFKTFDNFKKYVNLIEDVKSNTSIKKQNRSIINKQYLKTIHTNYGEYAGTYDIYIPTTMEQSIELQGYNTKWCTQVPDKNKNLFNKYRIKNNITLYYFINKDGYTTMITNTDETKEYSQIIMFQIQVYEDNSYEIFDNQDEELAESELYKLSGIKQSDYKWQPLPDGHYDVNSKGAKLVCNYKDGKLDGENIEYYNNGNIHIKCYYKDDKLDGEYLKYYENGNINVKYHYKEDNLDGEYVSYYENGNMHIKKNYKNGKYDKEYISYWDNGKLDTKQYYKNGELDGEYISYYGNGKIYIKQYYKNGEYDGEYIEYYNNGNIWRKMNYKDNKLYGEYIEYRYNGEIYKKLYYKDGIKIKGE